MRISSIKDFSTVDGPGLRTVFFLPGCIHKCDGCHNEELQDYNYGVDWEIKDIIEYLDDRKYWIDGITLSGGDPLYQLDSVIEFLKTLRSNDNIKYLNVLVYTGYTFDIIPREVKSLSDIIIDGKYDKSLPSRKFAGSNNQNIWVKKIGVQYEKVSDEELANIRRGEFRSIYRSNA